MSTELTHKPFKVVIVGAGAAGFITAAAIRKHHKHVDVTIVHDPKTPHIGVGESLDWYGLGFIKGVLGLTNEQEWMTDSNSTYKLSARHVNWTKDPNEILYAVHWWNGSGDLLLSSPAEAYKYSFSKKHHGHQLAKYSLFDIWLHLYRKGLVKKEDRARHMSEMFYYVQNCSLPWGENGYDDPSFHCSRYGTHTYNINSEYFRHTVHKLVGEPNGVKILPMKVKDILIDNGRISSLLLENDEKLTADLYIDCTGFKRALANRVPGFEWEDCNEYTNNSAIVGQQQYSDEHGPYPKNSWIEHYAMKHGWTFRVSFPERSGNGYQYNRNITPNENDIVDDYEQTFPDRKNVIKRVLHWDPGYYKNIFVENCMVLGISHGFADIFDANNLSSNLVFIAKMVKYIEADTKSTFNWQDEFNEEVYEFVQDIKLRIESSLHLAPRNDTTYWNEMKEAAEKYRTLERTIKAIYNPASKFVTPVEGRKWYVGAPQYATHALYYGCDIPLPTLQIDERSEQIALNFFKFFDEHNRINAQYATPVAEFYRKFYNNKY
jgi:tryptophan halogenase